MGYVWRMRKQRALKDYTGVTVGRLTAIARSSDDNKRWVWLCSCGKTKDIIVKSVVTGHATSCGCIRSEALAERNTTHGLCKSYPRTYRIWKNMRARCRTVTNSDFAHYGGRGIAVCERWDAFENFLADMGDAPDAHSIERTDVNGHYEPGNCVWADDKTQANNRRSSHKLTLDGVTKTLAQWCEEKGVEASKVRYRLKNGIDPFTRQDMRR